MSFKVIAPLLKDGYKVGHKFQYPEGTTLIYSNLTPRGTRRKIKEICPFCGGRSATCEDCMGSGYLTSTPEGVIAFGFQYFVLNHLIEYWKENFFDLPKDEVLRQYKRRIDNYLGPGTDVSHIGALHDLGYLPLELKAVPEGTMVPYRVPVLTIRNTKPEFFWLTNMLETIMSAYLWKPMTSATTAFGYRKVFQEYAKKTGGDLSFVPWQGHDFSFRGMVGVEDPVLSGAAHLLSFTGTDTIPAIDLLEQYYGADSDKELIGGSVPATEHSVMCMGLKDGEFRTFERLITEVYPKNIVSIVADTWDLWTVLTDYLPRLKEIILKREGKVVIRPDSGDPVKILNGDPSSSFGPERAGVTRLLYEVFGGSTTPGNYINLDPHIGAIYGDSITPERQVEILSRLMKMGFASTNVVLGIGSFTYEYVTRDTDGTAMKATYGEINGVGQAISKDPKTDNGLKKSASGLLSVGVVGGKLKLAENVTWEEEGNSVLQTIFKDGQSFNFQTLKQIRGRVESYL